MRRPPRILDTLTYIRELREERARERFGLAVRALQVALEESEALQRTQREYFQSLAGRRLDGGSLRLWGEGLEATFLERHRAEERLRAREKEVETLRAELARAHRERRAAETLRERRWRTWLAEEEKRFLREMDDLTLMRRARLGRP
ncbi:hypothetical protein FVE67_08670 [Thermosulfurimonas marina]|uniref:Flagellar FliJ protein n=1 Tax=Thermosulfurimonas marina TaxID=2047767 RepID=A0A6H1WUS4_9BACT|nr:flagellar FliJ family protein [Thermosulfurimonas marina]QJA06856.1 hypothetical protein FVE67_08670 [Thermosulfurimonas marina]